MQEQFVYPAHELHAPYRELTRDRNMVINGTSVWHKPKNVPPYLIFPDETPPWAKKPSKVDEVFYREGGVNLCNDSISTSTFLSLSLRLFFLIFSICSMVFLRFPSTAI